MTTQSAAPSGQLDEPQTYRCKARDRYGNECRGFLLRSRDRYGVLHQVLCSRCHRRVSVYLGEQRQVRDELTPGG